MFVGIKLTINIAMKLERRGGYGIFFVQSNIPINEISWKVDGFIPALMFSRDEGKSVDLYFKWSEIGGLGLSLAFIQKEYIGNNLAEYVKMIDTEFGATIPEPLSTLAQAGLTLGAISVFSGVLLGIAKAVK